MRHSWIDMGFGIWELGFGDASKSSLTPNSHGTGRPLVLLHGGLSATETSFGKVLTADIDRVSRES
jgi:hypothetical protein